jgi:hypothetical protein
MRAMKPDVKAAQQALDALLSYLEERKLKAALAQALFGWWL